MAKNIKINGVTYTAVPAIKVKDTSDQDVKFYDVSDTTAQASHVLTGESFYAANGEKVTGSMPDNSSISFPTVTEQHKIVDVYSGYYGQNKSVIVNIPDAVTEGTADTSITKASSSTPGKVVISPKIETETSGYISAGTTSGDDIEVNLSDMIDDLGSGYHFAGSSEMLRTSAAINDEGKLVYGEIDPIGDVDADVTFEDGRIYFDTNETGYYSVSSGSSISSTEGDFVDSYNEKTGITTNEKLIAANLPVGKTILGVTGTYTSDADAQSSNISSGKTAYVNGQKITGTLTAVDVSQDTDTKVVTIL